MIDHQPVIADFYRRSRAADLHLVPHATARCHDLDAAARAISRSDVWQEVGADLIIDAMIE